MIFPDFVSFRGLDSFELSVSALKELTQYFSSEFAIRSFIKNYPNRMLSILQQWATDENHHVRRLASEGCRPRLPWAEVLDDLKKEPTPILPILEILKEDESDYVRKSVANNLNDISKDHPRLVLDLAKKWYGKNVKTDWIVRHGCRTLLKKGDVEALRLFGFNKTNASVQNLSLSCSTIAIGGELQATFQLVNLEEAKLRIEYIIEFAKANQKISHKIFKLSEKMYTKDTHSLILKHSFKDLSTRRHYPGKHRLFIIVNGEEKKNIEFTLTPAAEK
jgi:3-methyladenine DNA glycosylase AlkC